MQSIGLKGNWSKRREKKRPLLPSNYGELFEEEHRWRTAADSAADCLLRPPFSGLYAKFLFLTLVIDGFPFILIVKIIGQK